MSLFVPGSVLTTLVVTHSNTGPASSASSRRIIWLPRTALSASKALRCASIHLSRSTDIITCLYPLGWSMMAFSPASVVYSMAVDITSYILTRAPFSVMYSSMDASAFGFSMLSVHPVKGVSTTRAKIVSGASPICIGGALSPMSTSMIDCVISELTVTNSSAASATSAIVVGLVWRVVRVGGAAAFRALLRFGTSVQPSVSVAGRAFDCSLVCVSLFVTSPRALTLFVAISSRCHSFPLTRSCPGYSPDQPSYVIVWRSWPSLSVWIEVTFPLYQPSSSLLSLSPFQ